MDFVQDVLLAALVFATSPVARSPVAVPKPTAAPKPDAVPTPDTRDPALRGLLLLAQALDETQADSCAAWEVLKEAAKIDAADADVALRGSEQQRLCEQAFDALLVEANDRAKEGDFASAQAIGRYVLVDGPPVARRSLRVQMVSWQPASVALRPASYDEVFGDARNELGRGTARLYKARSALRTATLLWPNGAEARKLLAETDGKAHERARVLVAETRKHLAEWKLADARAAVREALVLEAAPAAPHRADALALADEVANAFERFETPEKRAAWLAHCRKEGRRLAQQEQWAAARELLRDGLKLAPNDPALTVELDTVTFRCAAEAKAWLATAKKRPAAERAEAASDLRAAILFADGPADPVAVEARTLLDALAVKPR